MIGNETLKQLEIKTDEFVMKPNFGFVLRETVALRMGFVLLFALLRFEPETAGTYSTGDIGEILICLVCMVGFRALRTVDSLLPFCRLFAGCEPFVCPPDYPWRMR